MREREKRRNALFIKGIQVSSENELPTKLTELSQFLLGRVVLFSDVKVVDSSKKILQV